MMSYGNYYNPYYGGGYYDPYYGYGGGGYYDPYYGYGGGGYYNPYYGYGGGGYYDPYYSYGGGYYNPYYGYGGEYYNPYYGYGGGYYNPYYGGGGYYNPYYGGGGYYNPYYGGGYYPYNMYYQNYYDPYFNYYNSYYPNYNNVMYVPQYVDADLEHMLQCYYGGMGGPCGGMYPMMGSGMYPMIGSGMYPMMGSGMYPMIGSGMYPMIGSGMSGGVPMLGYGGGMGMLPQSGVQISPPVQIGRYGGSSINNALWSQAQGQGLGKGKLVYISTGPQQPRGMSGLNLNGRVPSGQALILYPARAGGVNNVTPVSAQNVSGLSMQQNGQLQPIILNLQPKPSMNYNLATPSRNYAQMQQQYIRNLPMQRVSSGNSNIRIPSNIVRNKGYFFDSYSSASRRTIPNSLSYYSR